MSYPSGGPGYPGSQPQPPSGGYTPVAQPPNADAGPSKLPAYVLIAVAVLGLAAYLLSYGPLVDSDSASSSAAGGWIITFAIIPMIFSALFAAVALLPKQGKYMGTVVATAVVGFLLVIWDLIKGAEGAGWALIVIVVVSALQTIAAIYALLLDAGVMSPPAPRPKYDQYQAPYGGGYGMQQGGGQFAPSGPYGAPHAMQQPGAQGPQSYGKPQSGYQPQGGVPSGPSTGGFAQPPHAAQPPQSQQPQQPQQSQHPSGPPTPPTGYPTYSAPPASSTAQVSTPSHEPEQQGSAPATEVASMQQQQSPPPDEGVTQQVRIPPQMQQPDQSPSGPPSS
jgi:hypothetical protein